MVYQPHGSVDAGGGDENISPVLNGPSRPHSFVRRRLPSRWVFRLLLSLRSFTEGKRASKLCQPRPREYEKSPRILSIELFKGSTQKSWDRPQKEIISINKVFPGHPSDPAKTSPPPPHRPPDDLWLNSFLQSGG